MPQELAPSVDDATRAAVEFCSARLGQPVLGWEHAGGPRRGTLRAFLSDRSVIVSRRQHRERAALEADVLTELAARGAPVPRVLAFDGEVLVQEDLGPQRLSEALWATDEAGAERWLDDALAGLAQIQQAGRDAGLARRVPVIGSRAGWLDNLLSAPRRVGERLALPAPRLDEEKLHRLLHSEAVSFIKWDARPGNAAARADGTVAWFDWEHCGGRNPLDDVAWLLGDEYTPDLPRAECRLLRRHIVAIAGPDFPGDPVDYLMAFGALHMCIRLLVILNTKADGPWWNRERCLADDKVCVTLEAARRTCLRAARWSACSPLTEPLTDWLLALPAMLTTLPPSGRRAELLPTSLTIH